MIGEIIAIGDELTSGRILNTNSRFAAGHLFTAGHEIVAMATIPDTAAEIGNALKRALGRADFAIVIGGLGPTSDDCTNEAVSLALDRPATFHPEILEKIHPELLAASDLEGQDFEKLAWLPAGAEVLKPESMMAGYLLVHAEKPVLFLPAKYSELPETEVSLWAIRPPVQDSATARVLPRASNSCPTVAAIDSSSMP